MKENQVTIRADRLNRPLETCFVGKLSSAVFRIVGDITDDIRGMTLQIGRTADATTHEPRPNLTAAAERQGDGTYRCYLSPFFSRTCRTRSNTTSWAKTRTTTQGGLERVRLWYATTRRTEAQCRRRSYQPTPTSATRPRGFTTN